MRKCNENLNTAFKYCEKNFSNREIFDILREDNDLLKPIAVLNIKEITSKEEAELLLGHLTGVDGKIREVVSLKLAELWQEYSELLYAPELFTDALCDVNPNVVRNILELPLDASLIAQRAEEILDDMEKICSKFRRNREKSHALNVKLFNLYWCLEGIYHNFSGDLDEKLKTILLRSAKSFDYTIREKVAKIAKKAANAPDELLQKLENDVNFYVKRQICDRIF